MSAIYNNGNIAFTKDLIFGWSTYGDMGDTIGWIPLSSMDDADLAQSRRLADYNPIFPKDLIEALSRKVDQEIPCPSCGEMAGATQRMGSQSCENFNCMH